jgi:hypothetical protein
LVGEVISPGDGAQQVAAQGSVLVAEQGAIGEPGRLAEAS